ncbi:MAG: hypothetical protein MUF42_15560 [Cytophagaceae bacterium]|jgi:hypothetical protein|nr:hypothetical protein [Cytophagaceae bacterium]
MEINALKLFDKSSPEEPRVGTFNLEQFLGYDRKIQYAIPNDPTSEASYYLICYFNCELHGKKGSRLVLASPKKEEIDKVEKTLDALMKITPIECTWQIQ